MANSYVKLDGVGFDQDYGILTLDGTSTLGTVVTKLTTILGYEINPILGSLGYTGTQGTVALETPYLLMGTAFGTAFVGTAIGSAAGVMLGTAPGTNVATFARAASATGNFQLSYFYVLRGNG